MNAPFFPRRSVRLVAGVAAVLAAALVHAQTSPSVRQVAPAAAPSNSTSPAGPTTGTRPFGMPNPTGLQSQFPAGLPSSSANPAGLPDPRVPNVSVPVSPPIDAGVAKPLTGGGGIRTVIVGVPGPYTATEIAGSFIGADANRDGELTRVEAQRLTIAPLSFEEMDANHDGILSRSEYESAIR